MSEATRRTIRNFVVENFLYGDLTRPLSDDDSFLEKSIVDSTGILELVEFLERTWNLTVQDEEIVPNNFDSIARLAQYVGRKQNGDARAS